MSYGFNVYDANGSLTVGMSWEAARFIGYATISYAASESGVKTATIPGLLASDIIVVTKVTSVPYMTVSVSGTTITCTRYPVSATEALSVYVTGLRTI